MSAKCKRRIGDYNRLSPLIAIACSFCPTLLTFSATIHRCDLRLLTYYQTHTQYARFHHFTNLANYSTPGRGLSTVMMSVCPLAYLRNRTRQLCQIICACFPCPWLGSPLVALWYAMYFRFGRWRHVCPSEFNEQFAMIFRQRFSSFNTKMRSAGGSMTERNAFARRNRSTSSFVLRFILNARHVECIA